MSSHVEMASVETAQRLVGETVVAGETVATPLGDALHRVLAEPVFSDMDDPPFDRAMMDGFAVRAGDTASGKASFVVVGHVSAGHPSATIVGPGQAVGINTGAPVPAGADAVVRVEDTRLLDGGSAVLIEAAVTAGTNVAKRGVNVRAGAEVLTRGTRLRPAHIAAAAASGAASVVVYRRPKVAILVTGDELVDVSSSPGGGQIRNSNGPMLAALVRCAHADAVSLGVAGDCDVELTRRMRDGLKCDFLCVAGGVSMGTRDLVPRALAESGVRTVFSKVSLKPGKPTLFGVAEKGTYVFALPGNPIGALVAFRLFVRAAIAGREGQTRSAAGARRVALAGSYRGAVDRQSYAPVKLTRDGEGRERAEVLPWSGSGDPFGFCAADALVVRAAGAGPVDAGEMVEIIPLMDF